MDIWRKKTYEGYEQQRPPVFKAEDEPSQKTENLHSEKHKEIPMRTVLSQEIGGF